MWILHQETTDRANTWTLIEEISSFYYKEGCCGLFLVCCIDSPQQYNVKYLNFPATLFITKIAHSLILMPTSLVLKLLYILSTSF